MLAIAFAMANIPFVFERILFVRKPPQGRRKALGWSVLELVVLYLVFGAIAAALETRAHGGLYPQGWAFYVTTFCFSWCLRFPGSLTAISGAHLGRSATANERHRAR